MKRIYSFLSGLLIGGLLFGGTVAYASGIMAELSHHRIFVDDQEVQLTAYNIENNNYVKLRDIGKAVGFNVYWSTEKNGVQIETDKPYTGKAPAAEAPAPEQNAVKPVQPSSTIIRSNSWSREDFSTTANPAVFTGDYDRALYNAIRQTIVDRECADAADYQFAYTMVSDAAYSNVKQLLAHLDGDVRYEHHVPATLTNYYEYPDYFAVKHVTPETYDAALKFIQSELDRVSLMKSDADKVRELNEYLCGLLSYDVRATSGISQTFSNHDTELPAACGSYARAFNFLCGAAGIPCITINTTNHGWNMVYVEGQWLHVDVSLNDLSTHHSGMLLAKTASDRVDRDPNATAFLKELLVPGSTR